MTQSAFFCDSKVMKRFQRTFHAFVLSLCLYSLTHASVNSLLEHRDPELEESVAALQKTPEPLRQPSVKDCLERYAQELEEDVTDIFFGRQNTVAYAHMLNKFLRLRANLNLYSATGIQHAWEVCCAANQALIAATYEAATHKSAKRVERDIQALRVGSNMGELAVALEALNRGKKTQHVETLMRSKYYDENPLKGTTLAIERTPPVWLPHWIMGRAYALDALQTLAIPEQEARAMGIEHKAEHFFHMIYEKPYADDHIVEQDCKEFAVDLVHSCCVSGTTLRSFNGKKRSLLNIWALTAVHLRPKNSDKAVKEQMAYSLFKLFDGCEQEWPRLREMCAASFEGAPNAQPLTSMNAQAQKPEILGTPFMYYLVHHLVPLMRRMKLVFDGMEAFVGAAGEYLSPTTKQFFDQRQYMASLKTFFDSLRGSSKDIPVMLDVYQKITHAASYSACDLLYGLAHNPKTRAHTLERFLFFCAPEEISVVNDMLVGCPTEGSVYLQKRVEESMAPEELAPWRRYARTRCLWFFIKLSEGLFGQTDGVGNKDNNTP